MKRLGCRLLGGSVFQLRNQALSIALPSAAHDFLPGPLVTVSFLASETTEEVESVEV
jgi:hypothetical protein